MRVSFLLRAPLLNYTYGSVGLDPALVERDLDIFFLPDFTTTQLLATKDVQIIFISPYSTIHTKEHLKKVQSPESYMKW